MGALVTEMLCCAAGGPQKYTGKDMERSHRHLRIAPRAREFSDVIVFRSPPLVAQRALFGVLAPIALWRGYRATYPQLSRTVLAPRT